MAWEFHHPFNTLYYAEPAVLALSCHIGHLSQADQAAPGFQGQALPVGQAGLKGRDIEWVSAQIPKYSQPTCLTMHR